MKFDDYKILSDRDYNIMKQNYDTLIQSETNDLSEILDKLYKQRQNLIDLNQNHKFDDMLEKIDSNISDIEGIIGSNQKIANTKQSYQIPQYWGLKKFAKQDINDGAIHPVQSREQMIAHGDAVAPNTPPKNIPNQETRNPIEDNLPLFPNTPQTPSNIITPPNKSDNANRNNGFSDFLENENENNLTPATPQPPLDNTQTPNMDVTQPNNEEQSDTNLPSQNTTKRNSPMQGSALSNIIKQLNVGAGRLLGKKCTRHGMQNKVKEEGFYELSGGFFPYPTNPLYPPLHKHKKHPNLKDGCEPNDIILSNQCDILRLILLYMMLRPNCRYISRLSSIACDQFEILQLLI